VVGWPYRLFETGRASLLTRVVLRSVKAYAVDLSQIHQDTTSVKLTGAYEKQQRRAVQLIRGYSKDHRPDLRQLVYEFSVTRDGANPARSPILARFPGFPIDELHHARAPPSALCLARH
jgi:hypothetical protein